MSEPTPAPLIEPDEYARLVRKASDEDLQAGLRMNGEVILDEIFRAMPSQLRRDATAKVEIVAEWRVRRLRDGGEDRWQVAIDAGECTVSRAGERSPDITFSVDDLEFLKLVTGNARGPLLFMVGKLRIQGDLLEAARFQRYFRSPRAGSADR